MTGKRRQVRNLVVLLGGSLALAFACVTLLVYGFGQSGTTRLDRALISPEVVKMTKITFTVADASGKGWGRYAVSSQAYAAFYKEIEGLRSLPRLTDEMITQFDRVAPSTLTLFFTSGGKTQSQQVQFLDQGDLFRVEKRGGEWTYFRAPGVYQKALEHFVPRGLGVT